MIHPSELVLNSDGSIYHLKLKPEQLAHKIIIVGDPGRVQTISSQFDQIEHRVGNREFITHTGYFNNQRISAIASGIGTDNIDIVLNELDALVNVDFEKREVKDKLRSLEIVRIGTCGSIQEDVPSDKVVISSHAIGLDGLLNFYPFEMSPKEVDLLAAFKQQTNWSEKMNNPYLVSASDKLFNRLKKGCEEGITITANGFYAPQGRAIRIQPLEPDLNERIRAFSHHNQRVVNYEMETSALYGLSKLMGHESCTVCAVVANRYANSFSKDYKPVIANLINEVLHRLTKASE